MEKILSQKFKDYNNGRFVGMYTEYFGFRRQGGKLIIDQWMNNEKNTYSRRLSTRVYNDTEDGRKEANEVYKRLRAKGYTLV